MTKTLAALLSALPETQIIATHGDARTPINAPVVEADADVQPGGVFVARKGRSTDGHAFIPRAISAGAAAIIGERPHAELDMPAQVPYAQVHDAQAATGYLAAAYYDFPSRKLTVIGITGTNGKTSTTHLLFNILHEATKGHAGYISTLAFYDGKADADTGLHVTTPGAPQVQAYLARMVANGLTHAVLEVTSHGLAQGRLNGTDFNVGVLTNLTHEHLDFHGSFESYRAAKGILFEMLKHGSKTQVTSILNADDPSYAYYAAITPAQVVTYAIHNENAAHQARDIQHSAQGTQFISDDTTYKLHLVGDYNVANALAALAAARAVGVTNPATIQAGLERVQAISGRMERIDAGQDFLAIVDFAHTPDALARALQAARSMIAPGKRVLAVFGSAGLRDVEKRRLMALASVQAADITILTAEDPRTEALDDILGMMQQAATQAGAIVGQSVFSVRDRGQALYQACQMARAGDVVLALGKGHEQSMAFGRVEYPWDDRDALRAALQGQPLRTLPTADE
jgi:UDP-N-acetylmuramoyl-L-alanyl-D-glutamate--2,6-diaminopimelate ligase